MREPTAARTTPGPAASHTERTRPRIFRSPSTQSFSRSSRRAAAPAISRGRQDSRPTGQAVARRRSASWLSRRVGHYHQPLRSGRHQDQPAPGFDAPPPPFGHRRVHASRSPPRWRTLAFMPRPPHGRTGDAPELRGKQASRRPSVITSFLLRSRSGRADPSARLVAVVASARLVAVVAPCRL